VDDVVYGRVEVERGSDLGVAGVEGRDGRTGFGRGVVRLPVDGAVNPPPPSGNSFAAVTMTSTRRPVMSPRTTSMVTMRRGRTGTSSNRQPGLPSTRVAAR